MSNTIKLFLALLTLLVNKLNMHLQPSLMFANKAGVYQSGAPFSHSIIALD